MGKHQIEYKNICWLEVSWQRPSCNLFWVWFPVTAWAAVSARDRRAIVRRVYFLAALRLTGSTWEKLNRWDSFL